MKKIHTHHLPGILLMLSLGLSGEAWAADICGNTLCEPAESCITCAADCSCGNDFEWNCADRIDNDLDAIVDCKDPDCADELACVRISNIEVVPRINIAPPLWEGKSKSAAPDKENDSTIPLLQLHPQVPFWFSLGALALVFTFVAYKRMRLLHLEDQDEW